MSESIQARRKRIKSAQNLKVEKIIYFTKNRNEVAISACRTAAPFLIEKAVDATL